MMSYLRCDDIYLLLGRGIGAQYDETALNSGVAEAGSECCRLCRMFNTADGPELSQANGPMSVIR